MDHISSRSRSERRVFRERDSLIEGLFKVSIPELGRAVRLVPADLEVAFAGLPDGWPKSEEFPSLEGLWAGLPSGVVLRPESRCQSRPLREGTPDRLTSPLLTTFFYFI